MLLQKSEMEKAKTKKANADKGNEKKTMKDKVLEKEFKLVRSLCLYLPIRCIQRAFLSECSCSQRTAAADMTSRLAFDY